MRKKIADKIKKEDSGFKEKMADVIIRHLDDDQKKEMVKKFREKHKDNPMLEEMVDDLKRKLYGDKAP